jgi:hypothetical protein
MPTLPQILNIGAISLLVGLLTGCQSPPVAPRTETTASQSTRNNAYSLLHQLLDEEKDISKLRFIKREDSDLKTLLKNVAATAQTGEEKLDAFAKLDPSLLLNDYRLPPGEEKTRADIGAQKEHDLLHSSGNNLEVTLLLTQVEALNYGAHLAKIAGENDFQKDRALYAASLGRQLADLRDQVTSRLYLAPSAPMADK